MKHVSCITAVKIEKNNQLVIDEADHYVLMLKERINDARQLHICVRSTAVDQATHISFDDPNSAC